MTTSTADLLLPGRVVRMRNRLWRVDNVLDHEFHATPIDGRDPFARRFLSDLEILAEGSLVRCPQTFARVSFLWCFMLLVGVVGPSGGLSRLGFGRVRGVARRAGRGLGRWRCASAGRRAADGSTLCGWGAGSC